MKKLSVLIMLTTLALSLSACGSNGETTAAGAAESTEDLAEAEPADSSEDSTAEEIDEESAAPAETNTLKPLPSGIDINNLTDCTVSASFNTDSFDWMGGNLKAEIYDTLLYDAVEVSQLKAGDTVEMSDYSFETASVEDSDYGVSLTDKDGTEFILFPMESGGVYEITVADDLSDKADLGEAELVLSQDVVLHDRTDDPSETVDITSDEIKAYMEDLEGSQAEFTSADTTLLIEGGEVTEITRIWRP